METWEVNLREIRHNPLVGGIGETVAFYYLIRHGFSVYRPIKILCTEGHKFQHKLLLIQAYAQSGLPKWGGNRLMKTLTEKQREYLTGSDWIRGPRWDYVAFRDGIYLVEVRTTRGGSPFGSYPDISEARALGFKPLLIIVRLSENWNVIVTAKELSS